MSAPDEVFADRADAGRRLAQHLLHFRGKNVIVLGLPRGGVRVAAEVARALGAPLDVIVVRKLGVPWQPEVAMGAIGEAGYEILDQSLIAHLGVDRLSLHAVEEREREVLEDRVHRLRAGRPPLDLTGRIAIIVDDGIATGATARVACQVARHLGAERVVLAVPVAPPSALRALPDAGEVVCLTAPPSFAAVGAYYRDFTPTTDSEVTDLLEQSRAPRVSGSAR